jgi:hypothetical protein
MLIQCSYIIVRYACDRFKAYVIGKKKILMLLLHFLNQQIRLYAPSDRVNHTQFALEVAVTVVELYTEKFNVSYPLPKLGKYILPFTQTW